MPPKLIYRKLFLILRQKQKINLLEGRQSVSKMVPVSLPVFTLPRSPSDSDQRKAAAVILHHFQNYVAKDATAFSSVTLILSCIT